MGRPQFEQIVAQAPRMELAKETYTSGTIAPGGIENTTIYAPAGKIARLKYLFLNCQAPSGATTGNTRFYILYAGSAGIISYGSSNFGDSLQFNASNWDSASASTKPSDAAAVTNAVLSVEFDETIGLRIEFRNNTDANATYNYEANFTLQTLG